jgi:hypothetical protein
VSHENLQIVHHGQLTRCLTLVVLCHLVRAGPRLCVSWLMKVEGPSLVSWPLGRLWS